jgi:hypothetical protein
VAPSPAAELLKRPRRNARPVGEVAARPRPGVYAWFLDEPTALPGVPDQGEDPIYVGMTSNLRERGDETHFSDEGTGFSTLRRSLGALLKDELRLQARPRGTGASRQNYLCYRFEPAGDARLTAWMQRHLRVAVAEHADPDAIEGDLIQLAEPPLNLNRWPNPYRADIMALRKTCVQEAERRSPRS